MTPALTGMPVLTTGTAVVVAAAAVAAAVGAGATEQALSCAGGWNASVASLREFEAL